MIDPKVYREMGLNDQEYERILQLLGREPTYTELGMFAVMWSEHCGYKYSRPILRRFREYRKAVESGGLENAGVVDIGDGWGIVMKVESHNHPSAVEPFQGAATGVGGILRDIFTMGARPIAILDSLRFGPLDDARNRYLFTHVVGGISWYGNCVGVPTVAGEVYFHRCYSGNPLVNAMAVGIVRLDKIARARAEGVGNPVLYVGSSTGRDGIHGATFASEELSEDSEARRPNVQMGDPFAEKLLIEATLEALATGDIVGIQDMGAAGLTCSTSETAFKGGTGMEIDVLKVPRREEGMTPYEVMLSESQERMLCIVQKGREEAVASIFRKWGLNAVVIGHVTDDGILRVKEGDAVAAEFPAAFLTDACPTYTLKAEEPATIARLREFDPRQIPEPDDYNRVLLGLLASPSVASKRWVYEQYDHMVQTQTVYLPGGDAAVLRLRGTGGKGIALKIDGNGRYCYLDPFVGGMHTVAECARNISCTGAKPLAVTDCLNFANPERPEIFWQFERAVDGIATACEVLETPVISGNVSFYNETPDGAVFPTPTIGMVGLLEDVSLHCKAGFRQAGDRVVLLIPEGWRDPLQGLGGSEYLAVVHDIEAGAPPALDIEAEKRLQACVREAIAQRLLHSAHDCSDGGLAVAMAECCMMGDLGAQVALDTDERTDAALFGETASRIVVSLPAENLPRLQEIAKAYRISAAELGAVTSERALRIDVHGGTRIDLPLDALVDAYEGAIPRLLRAEGGA
ncbi:MAG: phosphoribosylformylglycinamidine synthase subunit PurL [Armatimonadota bacterium]|nr:MAG: phosphoribosylformylglycinamidine synthase subunit PurL [Armatimonadota bacterium]